MNARRWSLLLALLGAAGCGSSSEPGEATGTVGGEATSAVVRDPVRRYAGFSTPESVLYDEAADAYLVSNIDGTPFEKDDRAFIARLSPEGGLEPERFIDAASEGVTLNAPKGMAIAGDRLYVADIDTVRVFDRNDGSPLGEIVVPGATFLNDVAVCPRGKVYVTDSGLMLTPEGSFGSSGTDAVYRVALGEEPVALARGTEALHGPNGILAPGGGELLVATFGAAEILRLSTEGETLGRMAIPSGTLDGLVRLPSGELLVSSWEVGAVFRGGEAGFAKAIEGVDSPADIGFDTRRSRVLVPLFTANEVVVFDLP